MPTRDEKGRLNVVIESPRGSPTKFRFEPERNLFVMDRPLPVGMTYPWDWGFVAGTRAADGDPLDALVLWESSSYPGIVIPCRAVAVLQLTQREKGAARAVRNDRLIVVPDDDTRCKSLRALSQLSRSLRAEVERFFLNSVFFEPKTVRLRGWKGAKVADGLADAARR
jgi:inorganic pyrophosphatase